MKETEIKFPVQKLPQVKSILQKKDGSFEASFFEDNIVFDDDKGTLFKNKLLLRLRKSDKVTITFKKPIERSQFKVMEEYEVRVSDFDEMHKILNMLGFKKVFRYQKRREIYRFGHTKVLLDSTPIGDFVEIEGEKDDIRKTCSLLGLDFKKGTSKNYRTLYREYCKEKGIAPSDMVFIDEISPNEREG
jgi:adenylate cyclase class 2